MDDDDFDDLLAGVEMFPDSSQESLTNAASSLDLDMVSRTTMQSSISGSTQDGLQSMLKEHSDAVNPMQRNGTAPHAAAAKIERIFRDLQHALSTKDGELFIPLRSRPSSANAASRVRYLRFPGKTAEEAWRFSRLVC